MRYYNAENAGIYDFYRSGHMLKRKSEFIEDFINKNNIKINRVADVGCGTGRLIYGIAGKYPGKFFTGYDVNSGFKEFASKFHRFPNLNFEINDIEKCPLPEGFDLIISVDLLHHLDDWKRGAENIKNSLNKNGFWIAIEHNIYNPYIFLFQFFAHNEKLFFQKRFQESIGGSFRIMDKKYFLLIPSIIKNPGKLLKIAENKLEFLPYLAGSVIYSLQKL